MNKKQLQQQLPIAKNFFLVGVVIAFGIFLIVPSAIPAQGFHKETALLKNYDNLQDLVNDIKNGKVDFKDFRDSDGIALAVMKDSEIYDKADTATKDCIDFAGKVGNSLGDHEIVHCSDDPNYFKNKFSTNTSVSAGATASPSIGSTVIKSDTPSSSSANTTNNKNDLIEKLVKTGQFTVEEAKEFVSKSNQGGNEKTATANATISSTQTKPENELALSAKLEANKNKDESSTNPDNPEDYNDLGQLVHDVKNGDLDADRISLNDFQNSGAYRRADEQTQACIDLAGKIGHNLDDSELVHCSEDTNYFKNKYSSGSSSSVPTSSTSSPPAVTGEANTDTNARNQTDSTASSSPATPTSTTDNNKKAILIDELVKTGKFTENEATEFAIVHELVNKQKFTEKDAINFAKKIMQSKNQITSTNSFPAVTTTPNTDTAHDVSTAPNTDTAHDVSTAPNTDTAHDVSSTHNTDTADDVSTPNTDTKTANASGGISDSNYSPAGSKDDNADSSKDDNADNSKSDNPEHYNDLGQLVHDVKNGDLDADRISLNDFQNSGAYRGADEQTQTCIDLAGKIGHNLDDSELVHCSEDANYFKSK